jgi:hypothetical protein
MNVQGSILCANAASQEVLRLFLKSMHDVMTPGVAGRRPKAYKQSTTLPSPFGPIRVWMYHGGDLGGWTPLLRNGFSKVMCAEEHAIAEWISQIVETGDLSSRTTARFVRKFLGHEATSERIAQIVASIRSLLSERGLAAQCEADADSDVRSIVAHAKNHGLPSEAIQVTASGLRLRLPAIASKAGVSPLNIVRFGRTQALQAELASVAAATKWDDERRTFLPTRNTPHGRETFPGVVFDFKAVGIARGGLLDDIVSAFPLPASHSEAALLWRRVKWLAAPTNGTDEVALGARRILGTPAADLSQRDAVNLVEFLSLRLRGRNYRERTLEEYLNTFKRVIENAFARHGKVFVISLSGSARRAERQNRGLVSDQPDDFALDPANRASIVNVATGNPTQAKERAKAHLDDRVERIRMACDEEIDAFLNWRAFISSTANAQCGGDLQRHIGLLVGKGPIPNWQRHWLETADLAEIASVVVTQCAAARLYCETPDQARRAANQRIRLPGAFERFAHRFPQVRQWCPSTSKGPIADWIALSAWYVPLWVQLAIQLRLQLATGWNSDTVRNLAASGILFQGATVDLQSIKGKTGEMQFQSIDAPSASLRAALELMIEHSGNVDAFWSRARPGIFVSLVKQGKGRRAFGRGLESKLLPRFIARHRLPKFTREQLRDQSAAQRYLTRDDPHEVQGMLGHAKLRTTSGYLQQTVIAVLNRANIAHFQRQLGASIVWAVDGETQVSARGMDIADVNPRLLFPVADQSTADGPLPAACDAWMADPLQSLRIDVRRLAHLGRQRAYYAAHWQRLRAESAERFEHVHRPRIEFTAALFAIVKDSPYAALLEG